MDEQGTLLVEEAYGAYPSARDGDPGARVLPFGHP